MSSDMPSEGDVDQQEVAEIRRQLHTLTARLAQLEARARARVEAAAPLTPEERRRRFTIIRGGGAGAVTIPAGLGALARYRPRRPVAIGAAMTGLAAAILVLTVPTGGTQPDTTIALPPSSSIAGSNALPPPAASQPANAVPTIIPISLYTPPPRPTPTSSGTAPAAPSAPPASTPPPVLAPSPAPSSTVCLLRAVVPGILHVCVK
jgi:hypothetical protein